MISLTSQIKTRAHDWPAGGKLFALCALTLGLLLIRDLKVQAVAFSGILALYLSFGWVFFYTGLRPLRVLWPFVALVGLWHWWSEDMITGTRIILRLLSTFALANFVTITTSLSDMMGVFQKILRPAKMLGVNPSIISLSVVLVIRLIPALSHKGQLLAQAWRARSTKRRQWRLILPLTFLALDDADHVAQALQARGGLSNINTEDTT